jgi:hypothetical protein
LKIGASDTTRDAYTTKISDEVTALANAQIVYKTGMYGAYGGADGVHPAAAHCGAIATALAADAQAAIGGAGTYPSASYVHADAGAYGPNGNDYTPSLSALTNWSLKSAYTDPGKTNVLVGHDYTYGGASQTASLTLPATSVVLTSAFGGPATYGVDGSGSTPQATLPAAGDTRYGAAAYGKYGATTTPTCRVPTAAQTLYGISVDVSDTGTQHVPSANDVRSGMATGATTGNATFLAVGKVQNDTSYGTSGTQYTGTLNLGLYTLTAGIVWPSQANVSSTETAWGPTGAEYHGTLAMSLYTLISGVVAASFVVTGHDNYMGGSAGSYQTTAASKEDQLATDVAAVNAAKANILNTATILTVTGTYAASGDYASGYSDGEAAQLVSDKSAVTAAKAAILATTTLLTIAGTLPQASVLVAAGGTYVDPANSAVWNGVAVGVSPRTGTKRASSIANCSAGNIRRGVAIDDVTGTYGGVSSIKRVMARKE